MGVGVDVGVGVGVAFGLRRANFALSFVRVASATHNGFTAIPYYRSYLRIMTRDTEVEWLSILVIAPNVVARATTLFCSQINSVRQN